jgi:hypothetical protein
MDIVSKVNAVSIDWLLSQPYSEYEYIRKGLSQTKINLGDK